MKNLFRLIAIASCLMGADYASATTYQWYQIHGNSCISISSGLTPTYSQYGVNAPTSTALAVTCPLVLPNQNYTYAYLELIGYNRSSGSKLSCTISGNGYDGSNLISATATLSANQSGYQVATASISPTIAAGNSNLYITCYLPGTTASGSSHLSEIFLDLGY